MSHQIRRAAAPLGVRFAVRAGSASADGGAKKSTPRIEMAPRTRRFMRELAGMDWEDDAGRSWMEGVDVRDESVPIESPSVDPRVLVRLLIAACAGIALLEIAWQLGA
jgi:hypothetical protein